MEFNKKDLTYNAIYMFNSLNKIKSDKVLEIILELYTLVYTNIKCICKKEECYCWNKEKEIDKFLHKYKVPYANLQAREVALTFDKKLPQLVEWKFFAKVALFIKINSLPFNFIKPLSLWTQIDTYIESENDDKYKIMEKIDD
jgi:hypothetical protein